MNINNPPVFNHIIEAGGAIIRLKILEIGAWNVDGTSTATIAHGLTMSKIRHVSAYIYNDTSSEGIVFQTGEWEDTLSGYVYFDATNIKLVRMDLGYYRMASFDDPTMNRGHIKIWYEE